MYILVVYKPYSEDCYQGNLYATYPDELHISYFEEDQKESLALSLAELIEKNESLLKGEEESEIFITKRTKS